LSALEISVLDRLSDVVTVHDAEGHVLSANAAGKVLFGADILGRRVGPRFGAIDAAILAVARTGEEVVVSSGGYEARVFVVPSGVGMVAREVTAEAVVQGLPIAIAVFDRELRVVRTNRAFAEIARRPADAILGLGLRDLLPERARFLYERYEAVLATGDPLLGLTLSSGHEGRTRHVELNVYPLVVDGRIDGVVGTAQNVTSRKLGELRSTLMARASGAFSASLDFEAMVDEIAGLFGLAAEWAAVYADASGRPGGAIRAFRHRHPERADEVRSALASLGPDGLGHEEALRRASPVAVPAVAGDRGLTLPLVFRDRVTGLVSLASEDDAPERRSVLEEVAACAAAALENARLHDVARDERRRADAASRAKDELLSVLSHELRAPLHVILGWTRMLLADAALAPGIVKGLETIERSATTQARILDDMLDDARVAAGSLRLDLDRFDLVVTVRAALARIRPEAEAKGLRLVEALEAVGPIVGDASRLEQALRHLLANAVKFTPAGGTIAVQTVRNGDVCQVVVSDDGVGIAPSLLPHVFERFVQAETGSRRRHAGLGVGLTFVRHVAELHGGTLTAASEGEGRGATFRLTLPVRTLQAGAVLPAEPGKERDDAHALADLSLLVVDDDPDARALIEAMLSRCAAKVTTCASVRDALVALDEQAFDLVVSDIGMPEQDGYDFVAQLRRHARAEVRALPAVALTAYARTSDRTSALLAGYDAHLTKPVDFAQLVSVLAHVVRRA